MYGDALDLEIIAKVEAIAAEHDATMAEVALAWLYSKSDICCPIIGASSVSQLENNVKALDLELSQARILGHAFATQSDRPDGEEWASVRATSRKKGDR